MAFTCLYKAEGDPSGRASTAFHRDDSPLVGEGAVLGAGVVITRSVPIVDVTGAEPVEHRGAVPPRAVVVPGVRQREFPAGTYGLPTPLIVGWRSESHDLRLSLNEALREHGIS